jgi:hypothetical protein
VCADAPPIPAFVYSWRVEKLTEKETEELAMPRYLVERTFPEGLQIPITDEGAEMCRLFALNNAEQNVTWIHSYVSDDGKKTYCALDAPSPEAIRRTAAANNWPVDRITRVLVLDPYFYR